MHIFYTFLLSFGFFIGLSQSNTEYKSNISKHRNEYKASFLHYKDGPLDSADLKYIHFFAANSDYVIEASVELTPDSPVFDMQTYSGKLKPYRKYGILRFQLKGHDFSLCIYQSQRNLTNPAYKDYLFLPFKDETNGQESYGGGRYIDLKITDISEGKFSIDFNKAYNPWCAYSAGYSCPIPPKENHLSVPIPAGEKEFTGIYKK